MKLTTQQIVDDPSHLASLLSGNQPAIDNSAAASILKNPYVMAAMTIAVDQALADRDAAQSDPA